MPVDIIFIPDQVLPAAELNAAFAECATTADLAETTGAGDIGTTSGATVQAALNTLLLTSPVWGGLASGTANALVLTPMPALTAYTAAQPLRYKALSTNTGAMTANWSGLGAIAIVTSAGLPMPAGDVVAGREYTQVYDPTTNTLVNQDASALGGPDGAAQVGITNTGTRWSGSTVQTVADEAAVDSTVVHLAGTEVITGGKIFTGNLIAEGFTQFVGSPGAFSVATSGVKVGVNSGLPTIQVTQASGPADAKYYDEYVDSATGDYIFRSVNDLGTALQEYMHLHRTGVAITAISLPQRLLINGATDDGSSAGQFNGNVTASGTLHATGAVSGSNLSGTNTGDQTNINGNAATATAAAGLESLTTAVVVSAAAAPTVGQVLTALSGTAANWQTPGGSSSNFAYGGDGSDGNVTISTNTTLTRDMFYGNLTINASITLHTNGFRVYGTGTFTNNGTVDNSGTAGTTVGGVSPGGSLFGTGTGATQGGAAAVATTNAYGGGGGAGGTSVSGGSSSGATATAPPVNSGSIRMPVCASLGCLHSLNSTSGVMGGGGGGAGGHGTTFAGPGGGGGGGVLLLSFAGIVNNGVISAKGGAGGTASGGDNGGGGGGGGGGLIILLSSTAVSGSGSTSVAGGAAGAKDGTGTIGTAGSAGTVINVVAN